MRAKDLALHSKYNALADLDMSMRLPAACSQQPGPGKLSTRVRTGWQLE